MGVNQLGHMPRRAFARLSAWATVLGVEPPTRTFTTVRVRRHHRIAVIPFCLARLSGDAF
jgi:hypothetical protein